MPGAVSPDRVEPMRNQVLDARLHDLADRPDLLDRLAGRIGDIPVLDRRGDVRALRAACERDGPVSMQLHLQSELLRLPPRDVDAYLAHRLDNGRPDLGGRLVAGGLGAHVRWSVALEEGLRHLRAAGVVCADE